MIEALKSDDYALWYHLSLARYLKGNFQKAATTYDNCVRKAETPENRTSCKAWQYLALVRAGRKAEAQALLDGFAPDPTTCTRLVITCRTTCRSSPPLRQAGRHSIATSPG